MLLLISSRKPYKMMQNLEDFLSIDIEKCVCFCILKHSLQINLHVFLYNNEFAAETQMDPLPSMQRYMPPLLVFTFNI